MSVIIGENGLEGGAGAFVFLQKDELSWLVTGDIVGIILVKYVRVGLVEKFMCDLLKFGR